MTTPALRRHGPGERGVAGAAGVRGAVALGAAVRVTRPRVGRQPLPAPHAGVPRAHAGAAAGGRAAAGAVRGARVARDAPVLGRPRLRAAADTSHVSHKRTHTIFRVP